MQNNYYENYLNNYQLNSIISPICNASHYNDFFLIRLTTEEKIQKTAAKKKRMNIYCMSWVQNYIGVMEHFRYDHWGLWGCKQQEQYSQVAITTELYSLTIL